MITDDQVATLIRSAGSAGPLPSPLDPSAAVTAARRDRSRTRAVGGLLVALVVVTVATSGGRAGLIESIGVGTTSGSPAPSWLPYAPIAALLLAIALAAVVTLFARRLPSTSSLRRALAAVWFVLALVVLSFTSGLAALLEAPDLAATLAGSGALGFAAGEVVVVLVLTGLCLSGRRQLRTDPLRPWTGALGLLLALAAGSAAAQAILMPAYLPRLEFEPASLVPASVCFALAWLTLRVSVRDGSGVPPWVQSCGISLLLAGAGAASIVVPFLVGLETWPGSSGISAIRVLLVGPPVVLLLGAWLTLPSGSRRWGRVLVTAVAPVLGLLAGVRLFSVVVGSNLGGQRVSTSALISVVVLAIAAVAAQMVVDRFEAASVDESSDDAEPPALVD